MTTVLVFFGVIEQAVDGGGHLVDIVGVEVGGGVATDFGVTAGVAGGDNLGASHMLQDG